LSKFGQKYSLMNSVTTSFNTTMVQMTEIFPWPKCISEKKNDWKLYQTYPKLVKDGSQRFCRNND